MFPSLILLIFKYHSLCLVVFLIGVLFLVYLLTLFAGDMNARVENLFDEMVLSCIYVFESMRTVFQNCLADVTGQLKTTCATL